MSDERTKGENTTSGTKKITFLSLLIIQMGVILYTGSGICSKMTANYDAFSFWWLFWVGMEVCCLGAYEVFWQQIIKHFDLSSVATGVRDIYTDEITEIPWGGGKT